MLDTADAADVIDLVRQETCRASPASRRRSRARRRCSTSTPGRSTRSARCRRRRRGDRALGRRPGRADRRVCRAYVARKRASGCSTSTTCCSTGAALPRRPGSARRWRASSTTCCVDEYQDVNALQVDIFCGCCARTTTALTVVGDDAQAVYGFRGASPRHLLDLRRRLPRHRHDRAGRNYRSTQPILDVANAVGDDAPAGFSSPAAGRRTDAGDRPGWSTAPTRTPRRGGLRAGAGPPGGGHRAAGAGRAGPRRPPQRPARARARPPPHPVREVRRAALPRGGPRQGPALPRSAWPTTRATSWPGSGCCSCSTASARPAPAGPITALGLDSATGEDAEVLLRWPLAAGRAARPPRDAPAERAARAAMRPTEARPSRCGQAMRRRSIQRAYEDADRALADLDALVAAAAAQPAPVRRRRRPHPRTARAPPATSPVRR